MSKRIKKYGVWMLAGLFIVAFSACGGSGGNDGSQLVADASTDAGTVSLKLMDAATSDYQAVYVTIDAVEVNVNEEWQVVATPGATYNLLALVNGVTEILGDAEMPVGEYSQLRMILGDEPDGNMNIQNEAHAFANYVIDKDGVVHELNPPGEESGVILEKAFTVGPEGPTELILDFNALDSIVKAGKSGQWLLKPRVKVLNVVQLSTVGGEVFDGQSVAIEGAEVRAQAVASEDDADAVVAATVTSENGGFQLQLEPGEYMLTASFEGLTPASKPLTVEMGNDHYESFYLESAESEAVDVTVAIEDEGQSGDDADENAGDADEDADDADDADDAENDADDADEDADDAEESEDIYVSLRFMLLDVDGNPIEIDSVNLGDGGFDSLDLPEGEYEVHATLALGFFVMEAEYMIEVIEGEPIVLDILMNDFEVREDADDDANDADEDEGDGDAEDTEEEADSEEDNNDKVMVCHKGHTITISKNALAAHLRHGDREGACGDDGNDEVIDEIEDEVEDIGEDTDGIEDEVEDVEDDLDDVEDAVEDVIDDVEDAVDEVEDVVDDTEEDLGDAEDAAKDVLEDVEDEMDDVEDEIDDVESEVEDAEEALDNAQNEVDAIVG